MLASAAAVCASSPSSHALRRALTSITLAMRHQHSRTDAQALDKPTNADRVASGGYRTDLPRQPVPPLRDTIAKLLHFSKPVLSTAQYKETLQLAADFERDGKGEKLHELLVERAKRLPNWLTPWWLNVAYLEARTPLPIVTSPGIALEHFPYKGEDEQLLYAARIINIMLRYYELIKSKTLKQDGTPKMPFDMSQYENLIGTTRVPRRQRDELVYGHTRNGRHIFITRNGHTFRFPVYDTQGEPLGVEQIVQRLRNDVLPRSAEHNAEPINLLTAVGRDEWADVYARLEHTNGAALDAYKDALFVIALDRRVPRPRDASREDALMRQTLLGGGASENAANRWFDKTVQLFLNDDGDIGVTYEHTPAEGPPIATLLDYVQKQLKEGKQPARSSADAAEKVSRLEWKLDEKDRHAIESARGQIQKAVDDIEIKSLTFNEYGKNVPKAAKMSPDSFFQLAFQVTYYRLFRKPAPTYETATLRQFIDGRTDTIRLPNQESHAFVVAFAGELEQRPAVELCEMLADAAKAHKNYSMLAINGQAMDRHLLGLRLVASEHGIEVPRLLQSAATQRLSHFLISTSQVPTDSKTKMGFGPSAPDCFGICYNPQEHALSFTVTAYNSHPATSARTFVAELERTLRDLRQLLVDGKRIGSSDKAKL